MIRGDADMLMLCKNYQVKFLALKTYLPGEQHSAGTDLSVLPLWQPPATWHISHAIKMQ